MENMTDGINSLGLPYKRARMPIKNFICQICGENFQAINNNSKYCSDNCRSKARKSQQVAKPKVNHAEIECAACGNLFKPRTKATIYCYDVSCKSLRGRRCAKKKDNEIKDYDLNTKKLWHLKKQYGITPEQWNTLLDLAGNKCQICGQDFKLVYDHDHVTGLARGILCHSCNMGIGLVGDNIEAARRAVEYLENSTIVGELLSRNS